MQQIKLACGCIPGFFLCPVAVHLWDDHNQAYYQKDYDKYASTGLLFDEHIDNLVVV